jgi:murein DD-endopeptidase MepM/ murein hydrolase activator NlpD
MSAGKATATVSSLGSVSSLNIPNDSRAAVGATRPRRVHAVETNATVLNETPAIMAPRLTAASALKNSRSPVAYVSFQVPVGGEIRSQFGMRRDPINGRMRLHQGIDIPAKRGTPIEAAAAGTVVFAGRNKGYGNMVMIEHADGRRTLYAHAQKLFVTAGDTVAAGETIAAVGSTGHSTGSHLHFEVREGNRSVNPLHALSNDLAFARR